MSGDDTTYVMEAWCICDTDGNRHEPRPLLRHIRPTERDALRHRDAWLPEDLHQYYPVHRVTITVEECPWQSERKSQAA